MSANKVLSQNVLVAEHLDRTNALDVCNLTTVVDC